MGNAGSEKKYCLLAFGIVLSALFLGIAFSVKKLSFHTGPPSCKGKNAISIHRDFYILCFNTQNKQPSWVFQMVGIDSFNRTLGDLPKEYYQDIEIPKDDQASEQDYHDGKWVIGNYLFPFSEKVAKQLGTNLNEQYLFSVTSPQNRNFNQGCWRRARGRIKELLNDTQETFYSRVGVFSGPLFLYDGDKSRKILGIDKISVPTHFFLVIIPSPSGKNMEAYVFPNQEIGPNVPLENFQVSIEKLKTLSEIKELNNVNKLIPVTPMPIR